MSCLLIPLLLYTCQNSTSPEDRLIYYNSFEKTSDLNGWQGIDVSNMVDDSSPNGGAKSVCVSGGCMMPTSTFTLPANDEDNHVIVQFYGKNLGFGGGVVLCSGDGYNDEYSIFVQDTMWTLYQSKEIYKWPAGSSLKICMNSGGYVASAMLIDELKIIKVF
jgi:hypothetical protein